jgi:KEOPS complex subunit Pcc1
MRRATITFAGPEAKVVHGALRPEAGRDLPKAKVTLRSSRDRLTVTIDAEDTSALRAAVNSYLRWTDVAMRVQREARG